MYVESELLFKMVTCGYCILVIFSNYFTVKRGNLAYFSSFLSLLKSNLKKSLICSTHMGPFWIAILILHTKSFQKIFTFLECLIFCLNQTLACCDLVVEFCCSGSGSPQTCNKENSLDDRKKTSSSTLLLWRQTDANKL